MEMTGEVEERGWGTGLKQGDGGLNWRNVCNGLVWLGYEAIDELVGSGKVYQSGMFCVALRIAFQLCLVLDWEEFCYICCVQIQS